MSAKAARLSLWQGAFVVARRDFGAILFSKTFIFFLLGPLFPILIGGVAGGLGGKLAREVGEPEIAVAMAPADTQAMLAARDRLAQTVGSVIPPLRAAPFGDGGTADGLLGKGNTGAVVTGSLARPELTGTGDAVQRWRGRIALIAATARDGTPAAFPPVATRIIASSSASARETRLLTAQGAQMLLFLLTMLLAGMVLSNLVEEKGNKVIEILAAAIPMDAVFLGKLFAMLAISLVGLAVWGGAAGIALAAFGGLPDYPAPALGWPLFLLLFVVYFMLGYLVIGSLFLAIGAMAATVREVQTLNMPVTMLQLVFFFIASFSVTSQGSLVELVAAIFPFSTAYAMVARAATSTLLWPHLLAIVWLAVCVLVVIRAGAALFRRRVMQSGPAERDGGWIHRLTGGRIGRQRSA